MWYVKRSIDDSFLARNGKWYVAFFNPDDIKRFKTIGGLTRSMNRRRVREWEAIRIPPGYGVNWVGQLHKFDDYPTG